MEELAIGANLKRPTARWKEGERFDPLAEFEDFRRQTDGLRRVVSNHAIFNRDFGFHLALLSGENGTKSVGDGQASRCNCYLRPAPRRPGWDENANFLQNLIIGSASRPALRHPLPARRDPTDMKQLRRPGRLEICGSHQKEAKRQTASCDSRATPPSVR